MKNTILLTGATGALGSMLLPRLLAKGYRVYCLTREKGNVTPQKRIDAITDGDPNAIAIRGDVREPRCGISERDQAFLCGDVAFMLHGAASISFESEDVTYLTNVEGVKNALELAETLGIWDFRHISTAYIAGNSSRFSESNLYVGQSLPNVYAHTKLTGETMVRAWARHRGDRAYTVFRPSILVGCEDGSTRDFNTYYGYMYPYYSVAESVRRRVNGKKMLPNDITVADGVVHAPLAVRMSNASTLNLVTIDWVADMLVELLAVSPRNETYHLVHPKPPRVREVLDISLDYLKVDGVKVVETQDAYRKVREGQSQLLSILQGRMDKIHDQYIPYVTFEPEFATEAPQRVLKGLYRDPPAVDEALLQRLLSFAIVSNWGLAKQTKTPSLSLVASS